jgi:hypothetical protein
MLLYGRISQGEERRGNDADCQRQGPLGHKTALATSLALRIIQ